MSVTHTQETEILKVVAGLFVILISVVYIFLRGCEHEYTQKNTVNAT